MNSKPLPPPPPDFDDSAPYLTPEEIKQLRPAREFFAEQGIPMPVPRGRPKSDAPKVAVTMRIDPDVLAYFKAGGDGWQTRMHEVLAREAGRQGESRPPETEDRRSGCPL